MKIKDITEGWGTVASNLAKDFVGMNRQDPWIRKSNKPVRSAQAPDTSTQAPTEDKLTPAPNSVFLVAGPGGMEYFKTQHNHWFEKPDPQPNKFSTIGALQISDPVKVSALEKILNQKHQTIFIKPAIPGDTVNFVSDPAGQNRAAKLAANRAARKTPGARE